MHSPHLYRIDKHSRLVFLALILAQAMHSIEEYVFRLYEVFLPARFISGLIGLNLAIGFVIFNAALVSLGIWCYITRVRIGHPSAVAWVGFWIIVEFANGIVHPAVALIRGEYFPGVFTAPILFVLSVYLAMRLIQCQNDRRSTL